MRDAWHSDRPLALTDVKPANIIKSVVHACRVLSVFHSDKEVLDLKEIVLRSGLPKTMAFRLLYTLRCCGLAEKVGRNRYRSHAVAWDSNGHSAGPAGDSLSDGRRAVRPDATDYRFSRLESV